MNEHTPVSIKNALQYIWGDGCDGWHLLQSDTLSVIQERMPPGTKEQLHYHEKAQQLFYILKGTAIFHVEDDIITVSENESLSILPNTKHFISNQTTSDLHFLVISQPKAHGDRVNL